MGQVAQDPMMAEVPGAAWCGLDEIHLSIGALDLKTPARLQRAIQILRNLDMYRVARDIATSSKCILPSPEVSPTQAEVHRDRAVRTTGHETAEAPLVALRGVCLRLENPSDRRSFLNTKEINCHIEEDRPFLVEFKLRVSKIFADAGLIPVHNQTPSPLTGKILYTNYLRTNTNTSKAHNGKYYWKEPAFVDANNFALKHQDIHWTTKYPLEQLCISELAIKDLVRDGEVIKTRYRDIASVPLPGNVAKDSLDEHTNDVYVKAAKSVSKNKPVTPALITLSPP